jgi:hypothetical protein
MFETIFVSLVVIGVLFFVGRSFYRTFTGKNDGCGCGDRACSRSCGCLPEKTLQTEIGRHDHVRGRAKKETDTPG